MHERQTLNIQASELCDLHATHSTRGMARLLTNILTHRLLSITKYRGGNPFTHTNTHIFVFLSRSECEKQNTRGSEVLTVVLVRYCNP
jgi:hypothetical protein